MKGRWRLIVFLVVTAALALPAVAVAQDDLREEFKALRSELADRLAGQGGAIDGAFLEDFGGRIRNLNERGLLEGEMEDISFHPSLYMAWVTCRQIADEQDVLKVQDEMLMETLNDLEVFSELYVFDDYLSDSGSVRRVLDDIQRCLPQAVARMLSYVDEAGSPGSMQRQFRMEELREARFWEPLDGIATIPGFIEFGGLPTEPPPLVPPTPVVVVATAIPTATPTIMVVATATPAPPTATPTVPVVVQPTPTAPVYVEPTPTAAVYVEPTQVIPVPTPTPVPVMPTAVPPTPVPVVPTAVPPTPVPVIPTPTVPVLSGDGVVDLTTVKAAVAGKKGIAFYLEFGTPLSRVPEAIQMGIQRDGEEFQALELMPIVANRSSETLLMIRLDFNSKLRSQKINRGDKLEIELVILGEHKSYFVEKVR